jgi:3-dehydroquinate dehydratase-2
MAKPIFVLNGPNLNMLGLRETTVYGEDTLADIEGRLQAAAGPLNLTIDFRQSNSEGELVGWIQGARDAASGLILNAAAYTHTSVALLDAVRAAELPTIEVHLSNVFQRENFRHRSYISQAATGVICGLGATGYVLALQALAERIER